MFATLKSVVRNLTQAHRFEQLFAMSENQLSNRGLNRDALVRSYITGLGHS